MAESFEIKELARRIREYDGAPLRIMEVCGTHTHQNYKLGIRSLLPESIRLIAGPGCPVCVTPAAFIAQAVAAARKPDVILCAFGDLIRVPGGGSSLAGARAEGADVRIVYSPLDAVEIAAENPEKQVVFPAVGFETTTPAVCLAVGQAKKRGVSNFSILCACKTMTHAYYRLEGSADAFLYPGHVAAITGMDIYQKLRENGVSGAVAGFTALELLTALTVLIEKCGDAPFAVNCYPRVVAKEGNPRARALMEEIMEPCDAEWRGLGVIENSGLRLRAEYEEFDASQRFSIGELSGDEPTGCRCGAVLRGEIEPYGCPLFGGACTPEQPVGACMVSSEGACAAYYRYGGREL